MPYKHDGLLHGEASAGLVQAQHALADLGYPIYQATQDASRQQLTAAWDEELQAQRGFSAQQKAIISANPTAKVDLLHMTVETGGSGPLGFLTRAMEFGTLNQEVFWTYTRKSRNGGTHKVTRRTLRQIPPRSTYGWIAYPAAGKWANRAVRMFQQIVVKIAHDAIDGGR